MDAGNEMTARILDAVSHTDTGDLCALKNKIVIILSDYDVRQKETALTVYSENKNENMIRAFLLAKAVAGRTAKTVAFYQSSLRRCFAEMGKDADTVTSIDIQCLLAKVMQRSSKTNANNYRRALSSFFGWAHREELVERNPMNKVEAIKEKKKKKAAFTDMDVELLRSACRTARELAIVDVLMSTGCRVSELVSIKTGDIDNDAVSVLGKGEKYRTVYLNAKAQLSLRNYLSERKDRNPFLFPRMADECRMPENLKKTSQIREQWYKYPEMVDAVRPADKGTVESICRKLGKRAGVENVHPHRFRRTCATMALRRGMPIEQVSKMLGHEQLGTTQIYLDLTEDELAQSHRKYVV